MTSLASPSPPPLPEGGQRRGRRRTCWREGDEQWKTRSQECKQTALFPSHTHQPTKSTPSSPTTSGAWVKLTFQALLGRRREPKSKLSWAGEANTKLASHGHGEQLTVLAGWQEGRLHLVITRRVRSAGTLPEASVAETSPRGTGSSLVILFPSRQCGLYLPTGSRGTPPVLPQILLLPSQGWTLPFYSPHRGRKCQHLALVVSPIGLLQALATLLLLPCDTIVETIRLINCNLFLGTPLLSLGYSS